MKQRTSWCFPISEEPLTEEELYEYARKFSGWAVWRYHLRQDEQEDLWHETFLALWRMTIRRRERGLSEGRLRGFLWRQCRWFLSTWFHRIRPTIKLPMAQELPKPLSVSQRDRVFRRQGASDPSYLRVELYSILRRLPSPLSEMLLDFMNGMGGEAVGKKYGVSQSYIYTQIQRLPWKLQRYCGYPTPPPKPLTFSQKPKTKTTPKRSGAGTPSKKRIKQRTPFRKTLIRRPRRLHGDELLAS